MSPFRQEGIHRGETMRIRRLALLTAAVALTFALSALAADVTGRWRAEFDSQIGVQKYTFELKVTGDKLTGKAYFERMGQKGEAELKEGKVSGDEVFFVEMANVQGNELRIEYKGKVAGDEIKFTRHRDGSDRTAEFTAHRAK